MTERDTTGDRTVGPTRRAVLAGLGAAGMAGLAGCGGGGGGSEPTATATEGRYAGYPVGETMTVGAAIPQTGTYSNEGRGMRAAYDLAVTHLNEGGGLVGSEPFGELSGDGVLDTQVALTTADTQSSSEGAASAARELLRDAVVLTGGASAREGTALQRVATDEGALYMSGFTPGAAITGADCSALGFTEMPNAEQMADALAPTLAAELGEEQLFAQVYPRSPVGEELFAAVQTALEEQANWRQLTSARTRVGGQSYEGPIREALEVGPDVLVLDYYGLDGANALSTARELVSGDTEVVTPLYNRPMAANSGGAIEGVLGTVTWDVSVTESVSPAFREAWRGAYADDGRIGTEPSGVAHVAYVQLLGYAAAVERAGTFEPPAVVDALEDHSYDVGLGTETMRACDHRAERPVPVVRGLPAGEQSDGRYFELVDVETGVTYGCDEGPASECSL